MNIQESKLNAEYSAVLRKYGDIQRYWSETGHRKLLQFIVKVMPEVLDAELCSVFIHDPDQSSAWLRCSTNLPERDIEVSLEGTCVGDVIASGSYQIRTDMDKRDGVHKQVDEDTGFITRNILCIPVKSLNGDEVTGAIQFLNKKGGKEFTSADKNLLEEMASLLELVIENIYVGQEMAEISKKIHKKIDLAGLAIKLWIGAMFAVAIYVIVSVTPVLLNLYN